MDRVTESYLDQFKKQYGYESYSDADAFELFAIYCVVSKYIKSEAIDKTLLDNFKIGAGGDWGIDGIVILADEQPVNTTKEIDDLLSVKQTLKIRMLLIQAKTSTQFKVAELGKVLDGAEYILRDANDAGVSLPKCNDRLAEYRNLIKYVYSKSADFEGGENPTMDVFYVTCGDYTEQQDHKAKIEKAEKTIGSLDLTGSFDCHLIGKKDIVSMYKDAKYRIEATIKVEHKIPLPEIDRIKESYLCLIPFEEYKKLIIADQDMITSVFDDNIRAFQGENSVNQAMAESLKEGNLKLFAAMNNGITIIARNLRVTGTNMHLTDYQIVNGCQTSHVLYHNQNIPEIDSLVLTVKIISSEDKDIRDKIIVGNNSQTEVKREQLVALLEVQKQIEDYYNAQKDFERLYYERRSKQYRYDAIPPYKVITIPMQIKAFVSMIMGKPDQVRGYYGKIVERFDDNELTVFSESKHPALYYTSALAYYKMTELFSSDEIPPKYKKIKFHLLLAFRLVCENSSLPKNQRDNKIQGYCDHLCRMLCDDAQCKNGFERAIELIGKALMREPKDYDNTSKYFTKKLFELANQIKFLR